MDEVEVTYISKKKKDTQHMDEEEAEDEELEEEEGGPLILASLRNPTTKDQVSIWSESYGNGVWDEQNNTSSNLSNNKGNSTSATSTSIASSLLQLRAPAPKVEKDIDMTMTSLSSSSLSSSASDTNAESQRLGLVSRDVHSQRMALLAGYKPLESSSSLSLSNVEARSSTEITKIDGFASPPHSSLTISSRYVAGELRYFVGKVLGIRPRHPRFTDNFFEAVIVCEAEVIDQESQLILKEEEGEEEENGMTDAATSSSSSKRIPDGSDKNVNAISDVSSADQSETAVKRVTRKSLEKTAVTEEILPVALSSVSSSDSIRPQRRRSSGIAAVIALTQEAALSTSLDRRPTLSSSTPSLDQHKEAGGRPKREVKQRTLFDPELEVERSRRPITTSSSSSSGTSKKKSRKKSSLSSSASRREREIQYLQNILSLKRLRGTCGAGLSDLSINASIDKLKNVTFQDYLDGNENFNFECLCPWEIETDGVVSASASSSFANTASSSTAATASSATSVSIAAAVSVPMSSSKNVIVSKSKGKGSKKETTASPIATTSSTSLSELPSPPPPPSLPSRPIVSSFDHPWLSIALCTRFDAIEQLSHSKAISLIKGLRQVAQMTEAKEFINPVDLSQYPDYGAVVPVPIDLTIILWRALCGYYRRAQSVQADVDLLLSNAILYNSEESLIVKNAKVIHDRLTNILSFDED